MVRAVRGTSGMVAGLLPASDVLGATSAIDVFYEYFGGDR